jgi:DNA-binding SARP family transcriptional activator/tetratricopeptide (TPR) repeat protein/transcriptional regulator with XRE-family HTH domain
VRADRALRVEQFVTEAWAVRFRVLGPLELRDGAGRLVRLGAPKQRTLLAVLLLHANQAVGVDLLAEALWGERPPGSAVGGLRTYVSGLRRRLGMGAAGAPQVVALPGGYQLTVAGEQLDLLVFERCAGEGQRALADEEMALAAARLGQAQGLWRGRAFEDVPLSGGLDGELARLQEQRLVVVEAWVEASLALGRHGELLPELRRLVDAEPLRERLWGQWMLALYRSGRQAEALGGYQQLRGRLVQELGIEPSPPLQQLQRQILRGEVPLALPEQQSSGNGAVAGAPVVVPRQPPDAGSSTAAWNRTSRDRVEFGRLLARFRVARGLSQEELADRSGMSVRAIGNLERGQVRRPRRTSIALLCQALALTDAQRAAVEQAAAELDGGADGRADARPEPAQLAPRQLPPDVADFTGRELTLERLHARMRERGRGSTAVVITAAVGKAGVGKTTLAVHAAHQLRRSFPDGQLYVNLRGVEAQALDPTHVLDGFLRALGIDGHAIPEGVDERARLYRSLLADRRMLVLLDNAADAAQVRPLLPAGAGNVVLITSRARLAGLALTEVIDLDVLPPEEAVELLGKIIGADRVASEPEAARTVVALCGYLPLALRIAGARLAAKPHWRLRQLADRLGAQQRRLDELTTGDLEVRASVALSYQGLGALERRAFRLLGLLEVPDFAPWMLSALLEVPADEAEDVAERLAEVQLLDSVGEDAAGQLRYRFHDLLRLYARERLTAEDTPAARDAALERTLQTYFATAQEWVRGLRLRSPELPGLAPAMPHEVTATLARSYRWLAAEHKGLVVSLEQAAREGCQRPWPHLTRLLADFFEVYACWDDWERTHQVALRAARGAGDRDAEASLLRGLGDLRRFQNRLPEAVAYFTNSSAIFCELEDTQGEIDSLIGLARTYRRQGRLTDAAASFDQCLRLCHRLGDRDRAAKAMLFFAKVRRQQGRSTDALTLLTGCRDTFRSLDNIGYAAYSDLMLGILQHERGEYEQATDHLQQALAFARTLGDPRWEAYVLLSLGMTTQARGSHDQARQDLEQSLTVFEQVGDRHGAARVRQVIASLPENATAHP